jgi:hypothetical protein
MQIRSGMNIDVHTTYMNKTYLYTHPKVIFVSTLHLGCFCRARRHLAGTWVASDILGLILISGRFVALSVEAWVLHKHVQSLLSEG